MSRGKTKIEVGGRYIDTYNSSETFGDEFECLKVDESESVWKGRAYLMRHVKSGKIDKYGPFDWRNHEREVR